MRTIGLGNYGNDAVVGFFVLSGLVITYVSHTKERTLYNYTLSRLARIYSVLLPCLVLTVALDYVGSHINYTPYSGWWFEVDNPFYRLVANVLLLNELWFMSIRPFSNGPFWSIGYEFWYYVMFGIYFYVRGAPKWLGLATVALLVGPKILMLLPVWLLGVIAYRCIRLNVVPLKLGWFAFLGPIIVYLLYRHLDGPEHLLAATRTTLGTEFVDRKLNWSKEFASSYIVGFLIAIHLVGANAISHAVLRALLPFQRLIRYLAGLTFTLYLLHYPALQFFAAVAPSTTQSFIHQAVVISGSLILVALVARHTERSKGLLRDSLDMWIGRIYRLYRDNRAYMPW